MSQILMLSFVIWGCSKKNLVNNSAEEAIEPIPEESVGAVFDRSSIEGRIQEHTPKILSCYEKSIKKNSDAIDGKVVMKFDIGPKGKVLNLEPTKDTLNAPELTACLVDVFSKIQFPAGMQSDIVRSDGTREQYVSVNYPLRFGP